MINEWISPLIACISIIAALMTLPGSWALARWTWAARKAAPPTRGPMSSDTLLMVVPAHNEAATLPRTLPGLIKQAYLDGNCTVLVIADNCTDETAAVATQLGAVVLEREDQTARGKGYALNAAFRYAPNYAWYLIVDADSTLDTHFLSTLRQKMWAQPAAIQSRYEPFCAPDDRMAELKHWALHAFNVDRQRGRAALHEGVSLLGNGFAVSRRTLNQVPYSAGSIVEDLEYQLMLQAHGLNITWLEDVAVYGEMPSGAAANTQRVRWEGGRLGLLSRQFFPLLGLFLTGKKHASMALQELCLLPLSLHALLLLIACLGSNWAALIGLGGFLILLAHVSLALSELPRALRIPALLEAPQYLWWKLQRLPSILKGSRAQMPWQRSGRHAEKGGAL